MLNNERIGFAGDISLDLARYFDGAYQAPASRRSVIINYRVFIRVSGNKYCLPLNVQANQKYLRVGDLRIVPKYYAIYFLIELIF